MSTSEIVEECFRKVFFHSCDCYVWMAFGKVDVKSFVEAVWKDAPEKHALLTWLDVVAVETQTLARTLSNDNKAMVLIDFPSAKFDAFLNACFVKAKVPKSVLFEKQNGSLWKTIEEKAALTKITSECDRFKFLIDESEEFLQEHFDEFVREYPDYERVALYLRNLRRSKRRKIEKE